MQKETKKNIQKATEKPQNYPVCLNKQCSLRDRCLHAIESTDQRMSATFITCVNPAVYSGTSQCPEYRDKDAITHIAFGMQSIASELKRNGCYSAFITRCLHHFCRTVYYEMLAGTHIITPADQRIILNCAQEVGLIFPPDSFDLMVEVTAW